LSKSENLSSKVPEHKASSFPTPQLSYFSFGVFDQLTRTPTSTRSVYCRALQHSE